MRSASIAASCVLAAACLLAPPALRAGVRIQHWQTGHGAQVYFVRAPELPMMQARVVFDAGSARDPGDRPGLASLTAGMLLGGTRERTEESLALEFERLGAELAASASRDLASVELRCLTDSGVLDRAVSLAAEVIGRPAFEPKVLERERARRLVALEQDAQSPGSIAERAFYAGLFGSHPYGHTADGTPAAVGAMRREDLTAFHARHYIARNAIVVLVGDLDATKARDVARRLTAGLGSGAPPPPLPRAPDFAAAKRETIAYPSKQAHILIGQPALARSDPDYLALYLANHILGGGAVSRLADAVRERAGLAYSVYSYTQAYRARGPWVLGLQTRTAQTDHALGITMDTLRRFYADGPDDQELEAAKRYLTGSFPLRIDSNREIAEYLAGMAFYGLPLDYLDTYVARIDALTREQVHAAFRRHIHPDRLLTVVVGNGTDG